MRLSSHLALLLTFSYTFLASLMVVTEAAAIVTLYEDNNLTGNRATFTLGHNCMNIQGKLNDYFSSVNTMEDCFLLFEHTQCRGKFHAVIGSVKDLRKLGLNDAISSLRRCTSTEQAVRDKSAESSKLVPKQRSSSSTIESRSMEENENNRNDSRTTNLTQSEEKVAPPIVSSSEEPLLVLPENSTS